MVCRELENWEKAIRAAYSVDDNGRVVGLGGHILFTIDQPNWCELRRTKMWRWVITKYPELEVLNNAST